MKGLLNAINQGALSLKLTINWRARDENSRRQFHTSSTKRHKHLCYDMSRSTRSTTFLFSSITLSWMLCKNLGFESNQNVPFVQWPAVRSALVDIFKPESAGSLSRNQAAFPNRKRFECVNFSHCSGPCDHCSDIINITIYLAHPLSCKIGTCDGIIRLAGVPK